MKITIYTPESSIRSPRKMLKEMWCDLMKSREMAFQLSLRDIKLKNIGNMILINNY